MIHADSIHMSSSMNFAAILHNWSISNVEDRVEGKQLVPVNHSAACATKLRNAIGAEVGRFYRFCDVKNENKLHTCRAWKRNVSLLL